MRTPGLIGGISWQSTLLYYRYLNEAVARERGADRSCEHVLYTVDFAEVHRLQGEGDWAALDALMVGCAQNLRAAGAGAIAICANTMHKCAPAIEDATGLPVLHIADAAAEAIVARGLTAVGLLGTRYTMEMDFYRARMAERYGLDVIVPDEADRAEVHRVIYDELTRGEVRDDSRRVYQDVIARLAERGAGGVVLGCTEIPLLLAPADAEVPTFDTTKLHAEAVVAWALG